MRPSVRPLQDLYVVPNPNSKDSTLSPTDLIHPSVPCTAQDLLAQICIPAGATSVAYRRRLLADVGSGWGRRLMAGGEAGGDGSGGYLNACGPGEESLWPVSLQHDTHVGTVRQ